MAAAAGTTNAVVKDQLLANGGKFSYFQAIRLLDLFARNDAGGEAVLRVRPNLSLSFPENDIDRIEPRPQGGYRITANFFGLYGVASPLPTYYTEDLFEEERDGDHATRDFLDVVHHALYPLLFQAWTKYRLQLRILEQGDAGVLNHLYAFAGLGSPELRAGLLPDSAELLRYAGLFNQRPRSLLGLRTMLADAFEGTRVEIDSCVRRALPIPADQCARLGVQAHSLGEDCMLGHRIDDYNSTLRIRFAALSQDLFHQLLPGADGCRRLGFLTRFYLIDPLHIDIELTLGNDAVEPVRTNSDRWSRLGLDSWLALSPDTAPASVKYSL